MVESELSKLSEKERELLKDKLKSEKSMTMSELSKIIEEEYESLNEAFRMPAEGWLSYRIVLMLLKSGDLKKYKSVLQKAKDMPIPSGRYFDKKAQELVYKKIVMPLHKARKIDPTKIKDLQKYFKKYGEEEVMSKWNDEFPPGDEGRGLWILSGTIMAGIHQEDFVKKPLGLKEGKVKGADGKACWKGYRYAGTKNGKDKCVKSEGQLTETTAKQTLTNAVSALMKTFAGKKLDQRYVKDYLKSMERLARKKPMDFVKDYGDFKVKDWIEDVEYNLQNESFIAEIKKGDFVDSMGEVGLVNKVKGQVAYVKFDSNPKSFHPMMISSLKKSGKHKGKDLYSESKLTERFPRKGKVTASSVSKAFNKVAELIKLLKANLEKYQSAEGKDKDKYKKIALDLTKKKKAAEEEANKLLTMLDKDVELVMSEGVNPKKAAKVIFDKLVFAKLIGQQNRRRAEGIIEFQLRAMNFGEGVNELNESMIGIKTAGNFKPADLQKALDKAKIKGYSMNRLSTTLTALKLDKKYFNDAKKIVDDLGLAVMMAKESVNETSLSKLIPVVARAKKGAKATGGGYGPFMKIKGNTWKNMKSNRIMHDAALISFLGGFNDFQINENKLTEISKEEKAAQFKFKLFLKKGLRLSVKDGEDKLYNYAQELDRLADDEYDEVVDPLFAAVELVQDAGEPGKNNVVKDKEYYSYIKSAQKHITTFQKNAKKAISGMKEGVNEGKLTEAVYDKILQAVPDSYSYKNLAADIAKMIKDEYGSHNIKPFIKELSKLLKENKITEATNLWKHFDAKMKLQDEIMDIEMDMKNITATIKQLHKNMEQEAEPGGGKIADKYGRQLDKYEGMYKKRKAEFKKLMAKLDKMEQY